MSVPERSGAYRSALAALRVKRGSTTDQLGARVLGLHDPAEGDRVILGGVGPHDQDYVCVLEVNPVVRHCTASERLCQSRNSCAVSNAGLMFDIHQA